MRIPNIFKYIACILYESILLFAILFVAGVIHRAIFGDPQTDIQRFYLFMYSWVIAGLYFVFCWVKSGQTLAMKTWNLELIGYDGNFLSIERAIKRYVIATFSLMFFGIGFIWALFDRDGLSLHDRFTGGRVIEVLKKA